MKNWRVALLVVAVSFLGSCSGGGDSDALSTDACGEIGLPTVKTAMRIIDGTVCGNLANSPVVRVILVNKAGVQSGCTGTMLTGRDVLTAAHCFIGRPQKVFVVYGDAPDNLTAVPVARWDIDPGFKVGSTETLTDDAAVLHLSENLPLPTLPILRRTSPQGGDIAAIYGYGQDETGNVDFEKLRSGEMDLKNVTKHNIEADFNGDGSNTCMGDSGGPLVLVVDGQATLIGVTSTGTETDCGPGDHSYFTNLQDPGVLRFLQSAAPGAAYY